VELVSEVCFSSALAVSVLAAPGFAGVAPEFDALLASEPAGALAPESGGAFAARSSEALFGVWSPEVSSARSARRCGAEGGRSVEGARPVPESAGRLESTRAPKLSFRCGWSGRIGFGGAVCNDTLAAASDVTLNTGMAFSNETGQR
jgi:hypothetical protein